MRRNEKPELKQLRKLSRSNLLELLLEQVKKNELLESEIKELKIRIEEQQFFASESESIAESIRRLNSVVNRAEKVVERCKNCKKTNSLIGKLFAR